MRRGPGGVIEQRGAGFIGAAFRHRTSRAGDPHLQTHVVISNMAQGPDGRWTALHASHIYAHSRTPGSSSKAPEISPGEADNGDLSANVVPDMRC